MRFCLLETSCEQEDIFPPGLVVKVNGKLCPLPVSINIHVILCMQIKFINISFMI